MASSICRLSLKQLNLRGTSGCKTLISDRYNCIPIGNVLLSEHSQSCVVARPCPTAAEALAAERQHLNITPAAATEGVALQLCLIKHSKAKLLKFSKAPKLERQWTGGEGWESCV